MTVGAASRPALAPSVGDAAPTADTALLVLAVDPLGLGGAVVRGRESETRAWTDAFCALLDQLPEPPPIARLPLSATADAVSGGLDVVASLAARAPCVALGLLPRTDGGVVVAPGAERLGAAVTAELCTALDRGVVEVSHDGLDLRLPARITLLALDNGVDGEETAPAALTERLALWVRPEATAPRLAADVVAQVVGARARLARTTLDADALHALCATAEAIGAPSMRATRFCARVALILAALAGRRRPAPDDLAQAAALVLAPRAQRLPQPAASPEAPPSPSQADGPQEPVRSNASEDEATDARAPPQEPQDVVIAAVRAALPPDMFGAGHGAGGRLREGGRRALGRGRGPEGRGALAGVRRADRSARRFALSETLKAAAPWQALRRPTPPFEARDPEAPAIRVAATDLRQRIRRPRPRTAVTLVVDASGSSAAQRLAEAKGAVEHLLDRCYARRDEVALLTFRGEGAQVALPHTRSLTRVRRRLGELAAGGATPLASAIEAGARTALAARDRGAQPLLVLLTDGRANVSRTGAPGRAAALNDALEAANALRARRIDSVFVDISPRGEAQARDLANAMGARYLRLPHLEAKALAQAVRAASPGRAEARR